MPVDISALTDDLYERAYALVARWNAAEDQLTEAKATIASATSAQDGVRSDYGELRTAAKVFGIDLDAVINDRFLAATQQKSEQRKQMDLLAEAGTSKPPSRPASTIREEVLAIAIGTHPNPVRATPLRKQLEKTRGPLHEKTVGMTLYRLSQEGLMRRLGRDWFFVPPSGGAGNPGGEAPGPEDDADD